MPFRYEQYHPVLTDTIAARMARSGDIEAQRAQQTGNAWAGAVNNIGQAVAAIPGQIQQAKAQQQEATLRGQSIDANNLKLTEQKQANDARNLFKDTLKTTPMMKEQGMDLYDIPAISNRLSAAGMDPSPFAKNLAELNDSFRSFNTARQQVVVSGAQKVAAAGNDPDLAMHFLENIENNGVYSKDQIGQFRSLIQQGGQPAVEKLTAYLMGPQKGEVVPAGATVVNPVTQKPMFSNPKPPTEVELAQKAAGGDEQASAAMKILKPQTTEQDNARYIDITARKSQKQPITAMEQAWADAYEKRATLATDKSASAAADRQTNAIGQATAQQKRSQDFTQLQAARADIQKNVDTPFLTARTSADTLRDVVSAAKAGNKVAGSLQSLETTMAAIRAQGLNRVNTAEIGATGDAGSLWDRISGYIGKRAEGQPVPADIQKDMIEFADILDKAATKKYSDAHDAVNKLYGTSIPKTFQSNAPAQGQAAGGRERVIGPNGETGSVPAGTPLPPGWRKP